MRQVFSSPRLENVEAVAQVLAEAGIEVRITDGRSYRGNRRGNFSYGDTSGPKAAVWVVQSGDQVRAREILREAGLIDSTRQRDSFVANFREPEATAGGGDARQRRVVRIKYAMLVVLLIAAGALTVHMVRNRPQATGAAISTPTNPQPLPERLEAREPFDGSIQPTLTAVAEAVFVHELGDVRLDIACMSVDGHDAPAPLIETVQARMGDTGLQLVSSSNCERIAEEDPGSRHRASGRPAMLVDVGRFRAHAADAGEVEYTAYHHRLFATYRTLEVRRIDGRWQVVKVLRGASI